MKCTMLHASGQGQDTQWFDWRPSFFAPVIRIEWELGVMRVDLPDDIGASLVKAGYAKQDPDDEPGQTPTPEPEPPTPEVAAIVRPDAAGSMAAVAKPPVPPRSRKKEKTE